MVWCANILSCRFLSGSLAPLSLCTPENAVMKRASFARPPRVHACWGVYCSVGSRRFFKQKPRWFPICCPPSTTISTSLSSAFMIPTHLRHRAPDLSSTKNSPPLPTFDSDALRQTLSTRTSEPHVEKLSTQAAVLQSISSKDLTPSVLRRKGQSRRFSLQFDSLWYVKPRTFHYTNSQLTRARFHGVMFIPGILVILFFRWMAALVNPVYRRTKPWRMARVPT